MEMSVVVHLLFVHSLSTPVREVSSLWSFLKKETRKVRGKMTGFRPPRHGVPGLFSPVDATPWVPRWSEATLSLLCPKPLKQAGDNRLLVDDCML